MSWHLGSLSTFLQDSISVLEQGNTDEAIKKFKEVFELISSLDRAVYDSISCLVPSISAWILRMREHYLSLASPNVSNLSKSKALYDKLDFYSLFSSDLIKSLQEEIKVSGTSELNRRLSQALKPSSFSPASLTAPRGSSASRFQSFRSRGSRPFRGSRSRGSARGQMRPSKRGRLSK